MNPKISIIIPCYNQAEFLNECLQSVLDQTFQNWECIIINDGSSDNTEEIATNWVEKDPRFQYFRTDNTGVSAARNVGIEKSKAEWILPLDGDDKIANQYLEFGSNEMKKNVDIIYCNAEYFGEKTGAFVLPYFDKNELLLENSLFCTGFFKKAIFEKTGGFDENMKDGYEDWEFWIRYLYTQNREIIVKKLDYLGFFYRIKTVSKNSKAMKSNDLAIKTYIVQKNWEIYQNKISYLSTLLRENRKLNDKNSFLAEKLKSKRYTFIDKILSLFNL